MKAPAFLVSLVVAVSAAGGCSTNAWYEGMKFRAQTDCRR
jgi:hypothetical protein